MFGRKMLVHQIAKLNQECNRYHAHWIESHRRVKESLQREIKAAREMAEINLTNEALSQNVRTLLDENQELRGSVESQKGELGPMRRSLHDANDERARLESALRNRTSEVERLKQVLNKQAGKLQPENPQGDHDHQLSVHQARLDRLDQRLSSVEKVNPVTHATHVRRLDRQNDRLDAQEEAVRAHHERINYLERVRFSPEELVKMFPNLAAELGSEHQYPGLVASNTSSEPPESPKE